MNIKVMGYLRTAREVAPHMIRQKSGRIINVSGLAARQTGTIIGSMRNVSVAALTKNLADELSPHGISAVCVHPGLTRTEKTPGVLAAQAKAQGVPEAEIEKRMAGRNLAKKIITARGDRPRRDVPRLAEGRRAERRRHRRRRRRAGDDPLLSATVAPLMRRLRWASVSDDPTQCDSRFSRVTTSGRRRRRPPSSILRSPSRCSPTTST